MELPSANLIRFTVSQLCQIRAVFDLQIEKCFFFLECRKTELRSFAWFPAFKFWIQKSFMGVCFPALPASSDLLIAL